MAFPFRKPYLKRVIRGLLVASALYIVTLGALSLGERHLLYLPFPGAETPHEAGLEGFSRQTFTTADGLELPYWESTDAPTDAPLVIYLHGNAGGLHAFAPYFKTLRDQKLHSLAMEDRGYAQAPGKPSEKAIVGDAVTFYDAVKQHYPNRQISIWGFSLGTGVAAQLAAARPAAAVVLEAPFSSTVDLAQHYYRIFPVRHLMQDQFL
jgi:pimeloyl-ACP methyl ester carboxylesterase